MAVFMTPGRMGVGVKRPAELVRPIVKRSKFDIPTTAAPVGTSHAEVRFDTVEAAQYALTLDGSELCGSPISVVLDKKSKDGTKVVITGVSQMVEWQELKDHFACCGAVAFADVKSSLPKGEIRFQTQEEAQQAIAMMNGASLMGSEITVWQHPSSKDGTKLQVSGMPPECQWQELKDAFSAAGTVIFADIVQSRKPPTGMKTDVKSNLPKTAEIRFETQEDAQQAIAMMNGANLFGATITVRQHPSSKDGTKLQVSGVPPECQWQELKQVFSTVGTVIFADIVQSQKLPAGIELEGEVRYDDPTNAQIAMTSLNGSLLGGAPIYIEMDPKSSDRAKLIIRGITPGTEWQELKDHFAMVGQVAFAQIHTKGSIGKGMGKMGKEGKQAMAMMMMKGFDGFPGFGSVAGSGGKGGKQGPGKKGPPLTGEVRFDSPMQAQMAVTTLNGTSLKGGQIQVDWDWKSNDGTKLWVGGLPPAVGWQDLKDHFAQVGQVAFADIKKK